MWTIMKVCLKKKDAICRGITGREWSLSQLLAKNELQLHCRQIKYSYSTPRDCFAILLIF